MTGLSLNDLLDYTEWERQEWYGYFRQHGAQVLELSAGPHGDGRFEKVGELMRHIFGAEKRYVDRLSGRPITDVSSVPTNDIEALFQLSRQSRMELRELVNSLSGPEWDAPTDLKIMNYSAQVTPKKVVIHVLMHEIRHWAQIATLLRLNGMAARFHDFLFSPVMGGEFNADST